MQSTETLSKDILKEVMLEALREMQGSDVKRQEWWNLREACERKGLVYKTACNRKELQPNRGIAEGTVGGRKMWHWTTIEKWLPQTDADILQEVKNEAA